MKRRLLKTVTAAVLSVGMVVCPVGGYIPDSGNVMVAYADDLAYEGFKYRVVDDSYVEITGYTGSEKEVVIPEKIDGYKVESIGDSAFYDNKNVTGISMPDSVKSIGNSAFYACGEVENVKLPKNLETIGWGAFHSCEKIKDLTIPETTKEIGEVAFLSCNGLTDMYIPESVTNIGESAFAFCKSLKSISVAKENSVYDSRNDCNAIIETSTNRLIRGCSNTVIPDEIQIIGQDAFSECVDLINIVLPKNVTTIEDYAFYECYNLKSIDLPENVTQIKEGAFSDCESITSIKIPAGVTYIGSDCFSCCINLEKIEVDDNNTVYDSRNQCNAIIKTEENELEFGCINTIIPEGIVTIGMNSFMGCSNLKTIEIPSSVKFIGYNAFWGCGLTDVKIPSTVTGINAGAFGKCTDLTNIELPNNLNAIDNYLFERCEKLESITIPESVKWIGWDAFKECRSLKNIEIPKNVTTIGSGAFAGCSSLNSIAVDKNNTTLDSRDNCNAVIKTETNELICGCNKTIIPDEIEIIGNSAFSKCGEITNIVLSENVTKINSCAFEYCSNLSNIVIPKSVTSIGYRAFDGCENLIITCEENSYAHQYAKDNNIKYELTGSTGKKANSITCTKTYKKNMSTKAQSFTLNVKAIGGTIKYKSNSSKVKVTGSGKVTIAKNFVGTSVITVTAGDSDYETVTKKITIKVLPPSTKITTVNNNNKGKLTVKWSKVSNITGYQLQYSTNAAFKSDNKTVLIKSASTTGKTITKLEKGKTYYVRIRTFKKVSGKKIYSTWSAKKKVKIV